MLERFEAQREASPHWFPASGNGGGAQQSIRSYSSASIALSRAEFESLTPTQRAAAVREGIEIHD